MSYYNYFTLIEKKIVDEIRNMNYKELCDKYGESGSLYFRNLPQKEVYNFGEMDNSCDRIYSKGVQLFKDEKTIEEIEDYKPYVVGKDGLIESIEIYKEKIIKFYEKTLAKDKEAMKEFLSDNLKQWIRSIAINTDINNEKITDSSYYEYSIFELVRLLKTINWDKYDLIFYGI